jgi:hypothetical protein
MQNRREALKNAGLIATTIGVGAQPVGSHSPTEKVELPALISAGEVVDKFTVPKSWDEHRKLAKYVLNNNSFLDKEGVYGVGLTNSSKKYGGKNGFSVELSAEPSFDREGDIPDEIEGVPIKIEKRPTGQLGGCGGTSSGNCVNYESYNYIHPGDYISGATAGSHGTYDDPNGDSKDRMITAAHLWTDDDNPDNGCPAKNDVVGSDVYTHPSNDAEHCGEVVDADIENDWAVIGKDGSGAVYSTTIDDNDNFPTISGYVPESKLQDWASKDKSDRPCLYNMGTTSSKTIGKLKYANYGEDPNSTCVTYRSTGISEGVCTYCDFGGGDSGGPTWHVKNGKAYLVSITCKYYSWKAFKCGDYVGPDSSGISAYQIIWDWNDWGNRTIP